MQSLALHRFIPVVRTRHAWRIPPAESLAFTGPIRSQYSSGSKPSAARSSPRWEIETTDRHRSLENSGFLYVALTH